MSIKTLVSRSVQFTLLMVGLSLHSYSFAAVSCITTYNPTRNINMGTFDPYNYTNIVIPIVMTITCSGSTPQTISYVYTFDGGGSGNMNARRMALSSNYVNYGLCTSSSCTQNYGTGSSGTYSVNKAYTMNTSPKADSWNLYVVVPVQPLSTPGVYNDTINVSISVTY